MKRTHRAIAFIALITVIISLMSCSLFSIFEKNREDKLYRNAIDDFFTALETKNTDGILSLFSKSAIEEDKNIQNSINKLIEIYPDTPTQILFDGLLHGSYTQTDGLYRAAISSTFPVFCGGEYYWIYLELVYEDDFHTDNIGISCIEFYTADEYCIYYHSDEPKATQKLGFHLFADKVLENHVISINNLPYEYVYIDREISLKDIKTFLNSNRNYSDFVAKFGEPNASQPEDLVDWYLVYYEVFVDGVAPVYVEICVYRSSEIQYANLVNSTSHLAVILEETTNQR